MLEKCPQCKSTLKKITFDIGYDIDVDSLHCEKCGFNITNENKLEAALSSLKEQMAKEVKIIKVGTGLGVRFPNAIVTSFNLKRGKEVILKPEGNGIKLVVG